MRDTILKKGGGIAGTLAIVLVSALLGMAVGWRAPGIDRYSRDWLMRARGPLAAPDDIAIVAIDEPSIARFGRFPWPRSIVAGALDAVAAAQPRVIALDILFTDPTLEREDAALAESLKRAGNVVVSAQLADPPGRGDPAAWLLPLPALRATAAAIGHVNVLTESEGIARELLVRAADDSGLTFRSMAIEAVRVGDRIPEAAVTDTRGAMLVGSRAIPVQVSAPPVVIAQDRSAPHAAQVLRAGRMAIDYIGPAGSFAPTTYSLSDVVEGRVPAARFKGRYVLIGATAASAGDRLSSPFVHHAGAGSNQHGSLMPGVEVLANAVNTILRSRFYREIPDWLALLWAALPAAAILGLLAVSQGRHAFVRQVAAFAGIAAGVVLAAYAAFAGFLIVLPLAAGTVSLGSAGLLGLLRRSLITSARLDASMAEMAQASDILTSPTARFEPAEAIAELAKADAVAIFAAHEGGGYVLVAAYGAPVASRLAGSRILALPAEPASVAAVFHLPLGFAEKYQLLTRTLEDNGVLAIAHAPGQPPSSETLRVCGAIAFSCIRAARRPEESLRGWPQGLEQKARVLGSLNARILDRTRFVDLAMRSVEDGLVIAGPDGRITFANRSAAAILGSTGRALIGRSLFERLAECEQTPAVDARQTLSRLMVDRVAVEREIAVRGPRPRQYMLRMAAVAAEGDRRAPVLGIVASFSDITRQKQLQQTKNDVISLVSHEMRTPLSAIQGMSELLANYDLEPARRREMNLAINDEVKRLTRMITQYLDITRLESGATVLRPSPVRVEALVERTLLLLEPLAAQREIRLLRSFAADLPPVLADPDLLARAVDNLVSNAIKYSPAGTEVSVSASDRDDGITIEVADQGYGIPSADLARVFEKFYRVPRVEDAGVPGTGLGLSLVREIAELHGGSVAVISQVNAGSTFSVFIPHGDCRP